MKKSNLLLIRISYKSHLTLQRNPPSPIQLYKMQVIMKGVMLTSLVQQQENQTQKWDGPIMDK